LKERGNSFAPWVTARPCPMVETPPEAERGRVGGEVAIISAFGPLCQE
jgi:hypothetical protein